MIRLVYIIILRVMIKEMEHRRSASADLNILWLKGQRPIYCFIEFISS